MLGRGQRPLTRTTAVDPYRILVGFNRLALLARELIPWRLIDRRLIPWRLIDKRLIHWRLIPWRLIGGRLWFIQ